MWLCQGERWEWLRKKGENEMKDMFVSLHLTQQIERPPTEDKNWLLSANKAIAFLQNISKVFSLIQNEETGKTVVGTHDYQSRLKKKVERRL